MKISPRVDPSTVNKTFGELVRKHRTRRGLTQSEVAEKMAEILEKPVNTSTINRIENGTRPTPLSEVYALSEALKTTIRLLIPHEDQLTELAAPIFDVINDAENDIKRLEEELQRVKVKRHHYSEAVGNYWELRGIRDSKEGEGDWHQARTVPQFQKILLTFLRHAEEASGYSCITDLGEAMGATEDQQKQLYEAEKDDPESARDLLVSILTDLHRERLRASS